MSEPKKSYYAIIPANVRYDVNLTPNAKLLYGEITALCNEKGYCWAGDKYFCDLYKVNRTTVQRWFKSLEESGYIDRQVKYRDGTREIEYRYTYLCDKGMRKNESTPTRKNKTDNNTSFNNTSNNTFNNNTANKDSLESRFDEIWKLYPNKKGKAAALKAYKRSVNKGVTDQDIKKGIERYVAEVKHKRTAPEYIKHGSTWFNQESWMDDYETTNETGKVGAGYAERLGF